MEQTEYFFTCPYCWENISMMLDLSIEAQTFVEDCEVCCHPMEIHYTVAEKAVSQFSVEKVQ